MEEKIIFKEGTQFVRSKLVVASGTLILSTQKLKWQKDTEPFFLTMIRRISFPDYNNLYMVDLPWIRFKR